LLHVFQMEEYLLPAYVQVHKSECEYRAITCSELTDVLVSAGFKSVKRLSEKESGFYQPIAVAQK